MVGLKGRTIQFSNEVSLTSFRAIRGQLQTIDFSANSFWLQSCRKLESFGEIHADSIWLEGCHLLDLASLKNVHGLRQLKILGRKNLDSLSFIADCTELQNVSITATDLRNTDIGTLENSKNLKTLFLGQCSKPLLREMSAKIPSVSLSNGDLTLINGQEVE